MHYRSHPLVIVCIVLLIFPGLKFYPLLDKTLFTILYEYKSLVYVNAKSKFILSNDDMINPLPDDKILDWSKLEQITDDILRCI